MATDVRLILTADNTQYVNKIKEAQQATQKLADTSETTTKRRLGLIELEEKRINQLTEARRKSTIPTNIEYYNKTIDQSKKKVEELTQAGIKQQQQTESMVQTIGKWAIGLGVVTTALNLLKESFKDTLQGMYLFNAAGAAMKQVLYNIVSGVGDWNKGVAESIALSKKRSDLLLKDRMEMIAAKKLMSEYNILYLDSIENNKKGVEKIEALTKAKEKYIAAIQIEIESHKEQLDLAYKALKLQPMSVTAQNEVVKLTGELFDLYNSQASGIKRISRQIATAQDEIFTDALDAIHKFQKEIDDTLTEIYDEEEKKRVEAIKVDQERTATSVQYAINSMKAIRKKRDEEHAKRLEDMDVEITTMDVIKAYTENNQVEIGKIIEAKEKWLTEVKQDELNKQKGAQVLFWNATVDAARTSLDLIYTLQVNNMNRELAAVDRVTKMKIEIQKALYPNPEEEARLYEEGEAKKLEIQRKYYKRKQLLAAAEAVMNTAAAILKTFREYGFTPLAIAAAIAMAAVGAIQLAIIKTQKFAKGGWTGDGGQKDETGERVAGVVHEKEFVVKKGPANKFRDVLEAINKEDKQAVFNSFTKLSPELLGGTQVNNVTVENSGPNNRLDRINNQLYQLNRNLTPKKQAKEEVTHDGNLTIIRKGSSTRVIKR
jgi:hypothetical protein